MQEFGGRARFVVENYGDSEIAQRFGVTRYPAIFVDDVLVAKPKDFGFYGKGEGSGDGRYTPFKSAKSHELFRSDLARMVRLALSGRKAEVLAGAASPDSGALAALPDFSLTDLDGQAVTRDDLRGRAVLVEFWATWCPPCRPTLAWLGELRRRHGDKLVVIAVAIESEEADVRRIRGQAPLPLRWTMGNPEVVRSFGDVTSVPTLLLFDGEGKGTASWFGAPPSLHAEVEKKLEALVGTATAQDR
ncbi:MAG TPA: TlpA disulfide reductase family protein [Vicinamibacteria bacterium]